MATYFIVHVPRLSSTAGITNNRQRPVAVSRIESTNLLNLASKQIMSFPSVVPHLMAFTFHIYRPDHISFFEPLFQNIIIHNLVFFQLGGHFAVLFMSTTNNANTVKFPSRVEA